MAVARGEGADQAATRRCRLSGAPPEMTPPTACRLHTSPPALRSAVVLVLLVLGISPSAPDTSPASVARSAATGLGSPNTWRRCIHLQDGRVSWGRGVAVDATWQGPGQVRPPMLTARTWNVCVSPDTKLRGEAKDVLSAILLHIGCCSTNGRCSAEQDGLCAAGMNAGESAPESLRTSQVLLGNYRGGRPSATDPQGSALRPPLDACHA